MRRPEFGNEFVDLVYLDPPYNSKAKYNVLYREQDGTAPPAQVQAFTDTWQWDQATAQLYEETVEWGGNVATALQAFRQLIGTNQMLAYLTNMAPRLIELHRVLKPTGSLYLHCDAKASHYLKLLLDAVFGGKNFLNNIVWCYGLGGSSKRYWPRKHDDLLWYSKEQNRHYFKAAMIPATSQAMKGQMKKAPDYWLIPAINNMAKERLRYPTQKPEALLERIIKSSSRKNDVVLDSFCGCGTTVNVAEYLNRQWIGIDITHLAIRITEQRLEDTFGEVDYLVRGGPEDIPSAKYLAECDAIEFQNWIVGKHKGRPTEKKGADKGIDGRLLFHDDDSGETKQVVISVKSGHNVSVAHVRDLRGVREREGAEIGVLLSLFRATQAMREEAANGGFYVSPWDNKKYPRLQILAGQQLFDKVIDIPDVRGSNVTLRKAPKSEPPVPTQTTLVKGE